MTSWNLYLKHGRDDTESTPEDWGYDGPTLPDVVGLHQTYRHMTFIIFKDSAATTFAQSLTGWEKWDDDRLLMRVYDDLIVVNNMFNKYKPQYFGDWGLILPRS